jgi:hypothetical protein
MRNGNRVRKCHQSYLSDLKPWVDQLYEDHRCYLAIRVHLFAEAHNMKPTVEVECYRVGVGRVVDVVERIVYEVRPDDQGHIEALALRAASSMLLSRENEVAQAERQTGLWPA